MLDALWNGTVPRCVQCVCPKYSSTMKMPRKTETFLYCFSCSPY